MSCGDYDGLPECGRGLHAFKSFSKFDFSITQLYSKIDKNNKFLTLEVDKYIDLRDKIKFGECVVKKCESLTKFLKSNIEKNTIKLDIFVGTNVSLKSSEKHIVGLEPNLILETPYRYSYISGKLGSLMIFGSGRDRNFAIIDGKKYREDIFYRYSDTYGIIKV